MNKVDFTLKNGRVERMHPKIAELLQRKGKGTYQTTALAQSPQRAVLVPPAQPRQITAGEDEAMREAVKSSGTVVHPGKLAEEPVDATQTNEASQESVEPGVTATPEPDKTPAPEPLDLPSLSVDQLRDLAKRRGVQVHHRAGAKTIIEAIEKKAEE